MIHLAGDGVVLICRGMVQPVHIPCHRGHVVVGIPGIGGFDVATVDLALTSTFSSHVRARFFPLGAGFVGDVSIVVIGEAEQTSGGVGFLGGPLTGS